MKGLRTVALALAVAATAALRVAEARPEPQASASVADLQAAFLINFARFTEWPPLPAPQRPLLLCVAGAGGVADSLQKAARGQNIGQRSVVVATLRGDAPADGCDLLFIGVASLGKRAAELAASQTRPTLTVSDARDFSRSQGIVELFVEDGRMRFAINVDAASRAGLRLSSRLLGLAKVVHDADR